MIKKIHIIWTGQKLHYAYQKTLKKWKQLNLDCEVILWTDLNSLSLPLPGISIKRWEDAFNESDSIYKAFCVDALQAREYATFSNFLRYHLLASQGGFYFDTDVVPVKGLSTQLCKDHDKIPEFLLCDWGYGDQGNPIKTVDSYFLPDVLISIYGDNASFFYPQHNKVIKAFSTSAVYCDNPLGTIAQGIVRYIFQSHEILHPAEAIKKYCEIYGVTWIKARDFIRSLYTSSRAISQLVQRFSSTDSASDIVGNFPKIFPDTFEVYYDAAWDPASADKIKHKSKQLAANDILRFYRSSPHYLKKREQQESVHEEEKMIEGLALTTYI